ncbi:hypothetical protein ON010_g10015 [Phytophthora cinnamomi]|nr:hypothetical protein ON010_g10015 [Phytophthora cinnamomi]
MEANFSYIDSSANVDRMNYEPEDNKPAAKSCTPTSSLIVFNNVRRPTDGTVYYDNMNSADQDIQRLQLGAVYLDCRMCTNSRFEAFCSAMVMNQTTSTLSIKLKLKPKLAPSGPMRTRRWWKWIAYAFFSNRARACSSLMSLAFMRTGNMSIEDIEAFTAVVNSDHPEPELFDRPCGLNKARDAAVKRGSPIR